MASPRTHLLTVDGIGEVAVDVTTFGAGRPVLLLHGGGGPLTVTPWAESFATTAAVQVIVPVHPGFGGTPRPDRLDDVAGLAAVQVALLDALDLTGVTVVGNSIGGWVAAEMAVLASPRVARYVLVDAVGPEVAGHPVVDFFALTPQQVAERSWFDPTGRALDPASMPPAAREVLAGNRAALAVYGSAMTDATLLGRLGTVTAPTLVVWGAADRICDLEVGRALAAAVPGARFELLERAGHLPQLETPAALSELVRGFALPPTA